MTIVSNSQDPKSLVIKLIFTLTVAVFMLQSLAPADARSKGGGGADVGAAGYLDNENSALLTPNNPDYRRPVEEESNCTHYDISAPLFVQWNEDADSTKNGNGIALTDCTEIVVK